MLRPRNYSLKISFEELQQKTFSEYKSTLGGISDSNQFVLQGHLYLEQLLGRLIAALLPRGAEVLESAQWSFHNKLLIVHSIDTLPPGTFEAVRAFNALRNKLSHKLRYEITSQDIQAIAHHLPWGGDNVMAIASESLLRALEAITLSLLGILGTITSAYEHADPPSDTRSNA
jgi:hypothetical protein